ncbi:MAG: DNA polymerase III subunit delta [Pseudomonadales bacterium]|nr:DNA polymerase III subunit delta [Pseudomonadales bacterium]
MNIRLEQLNAQLDQGLKPVYLVFGDEPLLVQEACDNIRAAARNAGFTEREVHQVDAKYKWDEFFATSNALSLFAERKIIELRLASGKPGEEGSKALQAYCTNPADTNLLLVIAPKLDKSSQNTKWFKALDSVGAHIAVWPVDHQQMPQWISRRMQQAGVKADREAIKLLAELVDGNLLAAAQEIEKLKLLDAERPIDCNSIRESVSDSSRYNVFNLVDAALKGEAAHTHKILAGLRGEGVEPGALIWALSREIRQLASMAQLVEQGQSAQQVMRQYHVWSNRQQMIGKALARLKTQSLHRLLQRMAIADQTMKGMRRGNVWDILEQTALLLAGARLATR